MPSDEAKWYVVHTYSGYENKVREDLAITVKNRGSSRAKDFPRICIC